MKRLFHGLIGLALLTALVALLGEWRDHPESPRTETGFQRPAPSMSVVPAQKSGPVSAEARPLADRFAWAQLQATQQVEAGRQERVDLDAKLAQSAANDTEQVIHLMTQEILDRSRNDRRKLLQSWKLSEAEMARIEQIQVEHWRMQYRDTNQDFLDRPSQIGDRSDAKRVIAYESKVRRNAAAAKDVFRLDLLAVLANPDRVEEYVKHEMQLVEKVVREARHEAEASMGKRASADD